MATRQRPLFPDPGTVTGPARCAASYDPLAGTAGPPTPADAGISTCPLTLSSSMSHGTGDAWPGTAPEPGTATGPWLSVLLAQARSPSSACRITWLSTARTQTAPMAAAPDAARHTA